MSTVPDHQEFKFSFNLTPNELAALLAVVGTSPMITQSENNAKFVSGVDTILSKYYTLAELGVVPQMQDSDTSETCVRIFKAFQTYMTNKMEVTKAKLCSAK